jgi:hypothetical protein
MSRSVAPADFIRLKICPGRNLSKDESIVKMGQISSISRLPDLSVLSLLPQSEINSLTMSTIIIRNNSYLCTCGAGCSVVEKVRRECEVIAICQKVSLR